LRARRADRLEELSLLWNSIDKVTDSVKSSAGAEEPLRPFIAGTTQRPTCRATYPSGIESHIFLVGQA